MANVAVSVPEDLKKRMENLSGVNWSSVARKAFEETVRRKQMLDAAEHIKRLRDESKAQGWNGVREIRKSRDAVRKVPASMFGVDRQRKIKLTLREHEELTRDAH